MSERLLLPLGGLAQKFKACPQYLTRACALAALLAVSCLPQGADIRLVHSLETRSTPAPAISSGAASRTTVSNIGPPRLGDELQVDQSLTPHQGRAATQHAKDSHGSRNRCCHPP